MYCELFLSISPGTGDSHLCLREVLTGAATGESSVCAFCRELLPLEVCGGVLGQSLPRYNSCSFMLPLLITSEEFRFLKHTIVFLTHTMYLQCHTSNFYFCCLLWKYLCSCKEGIIPFYTTSPQVVSNHTMLIYIMAGIHLLKGRFDRKHYNIS